MKFAKETVLNNRPHPGPLPRGEGVATARFALCRRSFGKSSRRLFHEAANNSPSPEGGGCGEGERNH
jgi:hypothetical protein